VLIFEAIYDIRRTSSITPGEGDMILLRAHRDHCPLCRSAEALKGFMVEGEDGRQRFCCVACLKTLLPQRSIPEPFGGCLVRSSRNGALAPPMAGSIREALETAAVAGFPGGLGGTIHREE
jgi:hypothetical protein